MADTILSLFDVSTKLGVSPSAIKKRVASLGLPVERGARGKLLFNRESYALLARADELLKAGHGFEECRGLLGLAGAPVAEPVAAVTEAPAPVEEEAPAAPVAVEEAPAPEVLEAVVPAAPVEAEAAPGAVDHARSLPAPVFIQLGRRKPSESVRMRMVEHQPTPTPMPGAAVAPAPPAAVSAPEPRVEPAPYVPTPAAVTVPILDPDLMARLDGALKLIEDKDKQNQMLQSKLLVAYDEMTKLSATAAAFQERSMNLQHEVQKLQGEIRLLTAPPQTKPWWKFWG